MPIFLLPGGESDCSLDFTIFGLGPRGKNPNRTGNAIRGSAEKLRVQLLWRLDEIQDAGLSGQHRFMWTLA